MSNAPLSLPAVAGEDSPARETFRSSEFKTRPRIPAAASLRCRKPQAYAKCVAILASTVSSRYSTVKGLVI